VSVPPFSPAAEAVLDRLAARRGVTPGVLLSVLLSLGQDWLDLLDAGGRLLAENAIGEIREYEAPGDHCG
jgi:hypothetical protein